MNTLNIFLVCFLLLYSFNLFSKNEEVNYSKAIEDNSFLIEEAYNQELRIVQHINDLIFERKNKNIMFAFTQEWPIPSQKHQFSFTIPYESLEDGFHKGTGDIMFNYRYQLTEHDDFITMAPRFSVILPTGDNSIGIGDGVFGFELCLPMSKRTHEYFVTHYNIGARFLPGVKDYVYDGLYVTEIYENIISYFAGASIIYLPLYNLNFVLEGMFRSDGSFDKEHKVHQVNSIIVNPGFRIAIDIGKLQIVPGLSLPIVFSGANKNINLFLYLSFEHPF